MVGYREEVGLVVSFEEDVNRKRDKILMRTRDACAPDKDSEVLANNVVADETYSFYQYESDSSIEQSLSSGSLGGSMDGGSGFLAVGCCDELCKEEGASMGRIAESDPPLTTESKNLPPGQKESSQTDLEQSSRSIQKRGNFLKPRVLVFLLIISCGFGYFWNVSCDNEEVEMNNQDTVYVPGAGFSGFWFTFGRLQSIENPASKEYYCFSAGCLGAVASLRNFTIDEMLDMAEDIQGRWKTSVIRRHDVVGEFVDRLVNTTSSSMSSLRSIEESGVLERIHIITSVQAGWTGLKTHVRTPSTTEGLKEMLLQTTWIPYAVGGSLWHKDSETGENHMDGAFTMPFHPKTSHFLGLPLSLDGLSLYANVVNVNLARDKVRRFWEAGFAYGI